MKIALVGKGGSGKSTLSWLMAKHLASRGKKVLVIDADQNADVAHNLGIDSIEGHPWLNHSEQDIYDWFKIDIDKKLFGVLDIPNPPLFSLDPKDSFTKKYTLAVDEYIDLIITGHHHEDSLWNGRCSHAYMKPVKFYLPYLDKPKDHWVVVDSPAGTDMLTYGLHFGADAIVAVVEDTPNSKNVAKNIEKIAGEFNIPFFKVLNKERPGVSIEKNSDYITVFGQDLAMVSYDFEHIQPDTKEACEILIKKLETLPRADGIKRLRDWREKNKNFQE